MKEVQNFHGGFAHQDRDILGAMDQFKTGVNN